MHSTILECASGGFQKSFKNLKKCVILRMRKKSTIKMPCLCEYCCILHWRVCVMVSIGHVWHSHRALGQIKQQQIEQK